MSKSLDESDVEKFARVRQHYIDKASKDPAVVQVRSYPWGDIHTNKIVGKSLEDILARVMLLEELQTIDREQLQSLAPKPTRFTNIDTSSGDTKDQRIMKLEEACQSILDFYNMDTVEFVDKYGTGVNTRTLCDKIREVLRK